MNHQKDAAEYKNKDIDLADDMLECNRLKGRQLTAVVADDGLTLGVEHPDHHSAVFGARHDVAVLVHVALRPPDARHNVKMSKHHLQDSS